jgi:hypothetical protein
LSLGCAGFARLDAFRPFFLTLTVGAVLSKRRGETLRARCARLLAALVLAFLPDILHVVNQRHRGGSTAARPAVRLRVQGVKCEACAAGFKHALTETAPWSASVRWRSPECTEVEVLRLQGDGAEDFWPLLQQRVSRVCSDRNLTPEYIDAPCSRSSSSSSSNSV